MMGATSWDELEKKYGSSQGSAPAPAADDDWAALEQRYAAPVAKAGTPQPQAEPKEVTLLDRARSAVGGVNRGFFADLLGLPADAAANVVDLGKAAIGYTTSKVTGKSPPAWTEPYNRAEVPLTAEWNARAINSLARRAGVASPIDNPSPDDAASRILHMGGRFVGSSVLPDPRAKVSAASQAVNAGMSGIAGLLAGTAGEVAPEWAGVAGMLPQAGVATAAGATKRAVRGGEAGRRKMEQRVQDLKNGGIEEPSVGLASGNSLVMGIENLLSQTPGSVGLYNAAREKNLAGMQARADQIRDNISPVFGRVEAGNAVQADLKGSFRDRVSATARELNARIEQEVGPDYFTYPENTLATARSLTAPVPGAPATSASLAIPRIGRIASDLASDVLGTPIPGDPLMNTPTTFRRFDGAVSDTPPGIPFSTLKNLRTSIGEEASSNAIVGTPEQRQFKQLYGGMSEDMRQAVNAADRQNAGVPVGPLTLGQQRGAIALNRANDYYSTAMGRVDDLNGLANRSTPESAYSSIASSLNAGGTLYKQLRGLITPAARQKLVATVVDGLGRATPGQQTADGEAWSPRTFLTNYAKLHENGGGKELFKRLPGGVKHADQLADIAKTAEMLNDSSKVWANQSGTAPALTARGTLYALTAGAFLTPVVAASTAAGLGVAHQVSQRLLLNPKFVHWLANAKAVPPEKAHAYAQRLVMNAKLSGDKQFQQDARTYLQTVSDLMGEEQPVDGEAE